MLNLGGVLSFSTKLIDEQLPFVNNWWGVVIYNGQIIATSNNLNPNDGYFLFQGYLGW